MKTATYSKLRDGSWGIRSKEMLTPGEEVSVVKRDGSTKTERVGRIVWEGQGACLASVASSRRGGRTGKWTGCSCGSRVDDGGELIPSASNCFTCEHDA